jgi:hypothetical protein
MYTLPSGAESGNTQIDRREKEFSPLPVREAMAPIDLISCMVRAINPAATLLPDTQGDKHYFRETRSEVNVWTGRC